MDFSKLKNKLLILLCIFVVLFPFALITRVFADYEDLTPTLVNDLSINQNGNFFISNPGRYVGYIQLEKGYKYRLFNNNQTSSLSVAVSSAVPSLNGTYEYLTFLGGQQEYFYIPTNNEYLYIDFSQNVSNTAMTVSREKLTDMGGAVQELASVVGPSAIWDIFDISINYIVIVVLFAFGAFLIFTIIRKISKGKGGV